MIAPVGQVCTQAGSIPWRQRSMQPSHFIILPSTPKEGAAQIRMVTHSAKDSDLRRAIAVIDALDTVREVNSVIRVESEKH